MIIDEKIKQKIIENKIILEKDWPNLDEVQISLAVILLQFLENQEEDDILSEFEQSQFFQEFSDIQDMIELQELDKVKPNKEKDFESISMRMPASFARFCREEIFPTMRNKLIN